MIVGSGNDKPTPRNVLDILGADPNQDPELLSFRSLGEGADADTVADPMSEQTNLCASCLAWVSTVFC
jgi:hypothetical protein